MGSSPPRPWANPAQGLKPLPTGLGARAESPGWEPGPQLSPRARHLGCSGASQAQGLDGGQGRKRLPPRPLGPNPSPSFTQAPMVGASKGQELVPLPQLKIAASGFVESPWGGGRKEQGCRAGPWGARLGRKCPGALPPPTPHAKAPVSRHRPLESPKWCLHTYVGQESCGSLRPGWAPLIPADNVLRGLDWSPAVGTRRPDEGSSSSLSLHLVMT